MDRTLKVALGVACMFLCGLSLSNRAFGQTLPDDKGKVEFVHNCTACHRADLVVANKKTPDGWRKSVDEMAARGTDGTQEDLDKVYLYLVKYWALDEPAPASPHPAAASSPPNGAARLNSFGVEHVGARQKTGEVRALFSSARSAQVHSEVSSRVRYFLSLPPLS